MNREADSTDSTTRTVLIVLGVVGGLALITAIACGGMFVFAYRAMKQTMTAMQAMASGMELQEEDYADARKQFRTVLTRQGPSPQAYQPLHPPADVQVVDYQSGPLKLQAWTNAATKAGAEPKPAVLYLHGGFAFGDDDWQMCKPFRDAGYVVLAPILRGENGQPGAFSLYYDEVEDVLAAADRLAQLPGVDRQRLFVAGHSAGGTLALLAAMASDRFKAASSFSGSPAQSIISGTIDGNAPFDIQNPRELQMRSPLAYATSFKCPVRLYYGDQEPVLAPLSEELARAAQTGGLDVQAAVVPGNHFTALQPALRRAIEFFQQQQKEQTKEKPERKGSENK